MIESPTGVVHLRYRVVRQEPAAGPSVGGRLRGARGLARSGGSRRPPDPHEVLGPAAGLLASGTSPDRSELVTKLDFSHPPQDAAAAPRAPSTSRRWPRPDQRAEFEVWAGDTPGIWEPTRFGMEFAPQKNGFPALHVEDVAAARAELEAKGVTFFGETLAHRRLPHGVLRRPGRQRSHAAPPLCASALSMTPPSKSTAIAGTVGADDSRERLGSTVSTATRRTRNGRQGSKCDSLPHHLRHPRRRHAGPGRAQRGSQRGFDHGGWLVPYADADMGAAMDGFRRGDAFLLGRRTYEIFAAHWPRDQLRRSDREQAQRPPKHVASRTSCGSWSWKGLADRGRRRRRRSQSSSGRPGESFRCIGSGVLAQTLMSHGLIDEYRLLTYPVVLGIGRRLFADGARPAALRLTDSRTTSTGVTITVYQAAGEPTYGSFEPPDEGRYGALERLARPRPGASCANSA